MQLIIHMSIFQVYAPDFIAHVRLITGWLSYSPLTFTSLTRIMLEVENRVLLKAPKIKQPADTLKLMWIILFYTNPVFKV